MESGSEMVSSSLSTDEEYCSKGWEKDELRRAVQIVTINDEGTKFDLNEKALQEILGSVPEGMKVSLVSVVGAFRTGKSFLLDFFLRYLRYLEFGGTEEGKSIEWIYTGDKGKSKAKLEGNDNAGEANLHEGFSWRAGKERNTTGIWIWGEPFIRKTTNDEKIAVFLVDTQGMFDSETSQMLTACIFGLSTLISSHQIYNVDKRIQEDNLQHLALFTEYGRMALSGSKIEEDIEKHDKGTVDVDDSKKKREEEKYEEKEEERIRPFQRLEFLVRDWQHFDDEQDEEAMIKDMKKYLSEILATRQQQDLSGTREQISECFEQLDCWLLPHPGFEITKKSYDGEVSKIRPEFLSLLSRYVSQVFDGKHLIAKQIHGRYVTASELINYIKVYVKLFREASIFPEAKTLLEVTAQANNVNMKEKSLQKYKREMSKLAGIGCSYVVEKELSEHHKACLTASTLVFDEGANMGRRSEILNYRQELVEVLEEEWKRFQASNKDRDPYKNLEFYLIPSMLVLTLFVAKFLQDMVCWENFGYDIPLYDCKQVSLSLSYLYWTIITFMVIVAFATGTVMLDRIKLILHMLQKTFVSVIKAKQE